jgi:hypothetical protein
MCGSGIVIESSSRKSNVPHVDCLLASLEQPLVEVRQFREYLEECNYTEKI